MLFLNDTIFLIGREISTCINVHMMYLLNFSKSTFVPIVIQQKGFVEYDMTPGLRLDGHYIVRYDLTRSTRPKGWNRFLSSTYKNPCIFYITKSSIRLLCNRSNSLYQTAFKIGNNDVPLEVRHCFWFFAPTDRTPIALLSIFFSFLVSKRCVKRGSAIQFSLFVFLSQRIYVPVAFWRLTIENFADYCVFCNINGLFQGYVLVI